jgi:hypothetical protein
MGGNALSCDTRRYQADEYHSLSVSVLNRLKYPASIIDAALIPAYRKKESFGDMDILYTSYEPLSVEDVRRLFPYSKEFKRNSEVISFEHIGLQIDLIWVDQKSFSYALGYFSYNDVAGNLVGKIARRFGLKHGHIGLTLPLRDESNEFAEIPITYDFGDALTFLDVDYERYKQGFDDLVSLFEWVSASKYFNPDAYKLENVSSYGRVRDKKRVTYQEFLKYINTKTFDVIPMNEDKSVYLDRIFSVFPEAEEPYELACMQLGRQKFIRQKFNGDIVSELTSLKDKELGSLMKELRNDRLFDKNSLVWLSDEQIRKNILNHYSNWTKSMV